MINITACKKPGGKVRRYSSDLDLPLPMEVLVQLAARLPGRTDGSALYGLASLQTKLVTCRICGPGSLFFETPARAAPGAGGSPPPVYLQPHPPPSTTISSPTIMAGSRRQVHFEIFVRLVLGDGFGGNLDLNLIFLAQPGHHFLKVLSGLAVGFVHKTLTFSNVILLSDSVISSPAAMRGSISEGGR